MKQNNRLLILGVGPLAREVKEMSEDLFDYDVAGFVVNEPPFEKHSKILGKPIYWIDELETLSQDHIAVCALARMRKTKIIQQVNEFGINFCNLIHPTACLSRSVTLGSGLIIKGGVQIGPNTTIENHVVIGRGVMIGGNSRIQENSFIASGVILAGSTTIGSCSFLGLGCMVLDHKTVGHHSVIGAGSLVTRNLPDRVKVFGTPAVILEKDIEGF